MLYLYWTRQSIACAQNKLNMWQSWVEIEHYSIAYFDQISALKSNLAQYFC